MTVVVYWVCDVCKVARERNTTGYLPDGWRHDTYRGDMCPDCARP